MGPWRSGMTYSRVCGAATAKGHEHVRVIRRQDPLHPPSSKGQVIFILRVAAIQTATCAAICLPMAERRTGAADRWQDPPPLLPQRGEAIVLAGDAERAPGRSAATWAAGESTSGLLGGRTRSFSSALAHFRCTHVATPTRTIEITTNTAESAFTSGVTAVFSMP